MPSYLRTLLAVITLGLFSLCSNAVYAYDGFVTSIRYQLDKPGNIHDGSTPGQLIRYDIKDSVVQGSKVLSEGITEARIGPFGQRIAFCRGDGTLGMMNIDGGEVV